MRTVLVPVDFSDTSLNAATYAVKMLTGIYGVNMLLYHMYEKPEHAAATDEQLIKLKSSLFDAGIVKMQTVSEQGHGFAGSFERYVSDTRPDMIIMGITGKNKIEQTFVGSNTLHIIKKNLCPVVIVPPGAKFSKLKNIALASDFNHAPSVAIASVIKNLLSGYFARLHIVNVNPAHHVSITDAYQKVKDEMNELFKGYEHDFHFIGLYDLPQTLNMFVNDHNIDMIITLPRDQSWLSTLLGNSHTKRMSYQSIVPVLAIHQ
jgi:nucleotide-binding universal stress UspA family protein